MAYADDGEFFVKLLDDIRELCKDSYGPDCLVEWDFDDSGLTVDKKNPMMILVRVWEGQYDE
jgi:hypothetical protein